MTLDEYCDRLKLALLEASEMLAESGKSAFAISAIGLFADDPRTIGRIESRIRDTVPSPPPTACAQKRARLDFLRSTYRGLTYLAGVTMWARTMFANLSHEVVEEAWPPSEWS